MEAYKTGYSQKVTHPTTNPARQGLTSLTGLELVCKSDERVYSMVVENGKPNFYFPFIWVSTCEALAPFRTKVIYIFL